MGAKQIARTRRVFGVVDIIYGDKHRRRKVLTVPETAFKAWKIVYRMDFEVVDLVVEYSWN